MGDLFEVRKKELYGVAPYSEPYCYENDREETWHLCGCREGFDDGVDFTKDTILQLIKDFGLKYMSGEGVDSLVCDIENKLNV